MVDADHHAKYCQNQSISCKAIKIFEFFKMVAADILYFQIKKFHWQTVFGRSRLIIVLNVIKIDRSIAEIL